MSMLIFKIAFIFMVLTGSTTTPPEKGNEGDVLVYKAREKADSTSMATTERIIIHDINTDVRHTVITYTNAMEYGMGYAEFPLEVSLDGRFVFNVGSSTQVWDNGEIIELIDGFNYQWSADGQLAFIGYDNNENDIYSWDDGELTSLGIPDLDIGLIAGFDQGNDGRFLFYTWSSPDLYVWDEGKITNLNPDPAEGQALIIKAAWNEDGRIAFIAGQNPDWTMYLWADDQMTKLAPAFTGLTWGLDGRLAYSDGATIYVWKDYQTQRIGKGYSPQWSADGRLAFASQNRSELYSWNGSSVTEIAAVQDFYAPRWNTDGRLVFSDGDVYIWDEGTFTRLTDTPDIDEIDPQWLR
jgi:hypothetical protein